MWTCMTGPFELFTHVTKVHKYPRSCMFGDGLLLDSGARKPGKPNAESFRK